MNRGTRTLLGRQRGIGFFTLLLLAILLGGVGLIGLKLFPDVTDYLTIVKDVKATAQDPSTKDLSIAEIRTAYSKRAEIDSIKSITPADLEITKEDGNVIITFAYSRKIPMFANASVVLDFEGSSEKK